MGLNSMMKTRDHYWDSVKFFLMCMVVFMHTCVVYEKDPDSVSMGLYNFCYFFAMPLFTFVSGRFTKIGSKKKFFWGIIGLMETFFLFQLIQIIEKDCLIGHEALKPLKMFYMLQWAMWYLPALVIWRLMTWAIPEHIRTQHPKMVLAASFIISLLVGFLPVKKYSMFIQAFTIMPFFFLGYYSNMVDFKKKMERIPLWVAFGAIALIFLLFCFVFNGRITSHFEYGLTYLGCIGPSVLFNFALRIFHFIGVTVAGVLWMRLIPDNKSVVSEWGQGTLAIYMFHPVILLLVKVCNEQEWLPSTPWWALLTATIIVVGLGMLSRYEWMKMMMAPITYWIKKRL